MELNELEKIIAYSFVDKSLLLRAVTHSSFANEKLGNPAKGNERLEFLGDAVLGACMARYLYKAFPRRGEGELTKMRAAVVCEASLSAVGKKLGINEFLLLSHGEESGGGRDRNSIIADSVEAVIGAVYLDGGFDAACEVVENILSDTVRKCAEGKLPKDAKTTLQELLGRKGGSDSLIKYEISDESGPDHAKTFTAVVYIDGKAAGRGSGRSKKKAEQEAASDALTAMNTEKKDVF